ncbi:hypothetical protein [Natronobacterium texcoconense]|nr:hypothetical protein [Natronobacterium texcoconense]
MAATIIVGQRESTLEFASRRLGCPVPAVSVVVSDGDDAIYPGDGA